MWLLLLKGKGFVATLYAAVVVDKVRWQSKMSGKCQRVTVNAHN